MIEMLKKTASELDDSNDTACKCEKSHGAVRETASLGKMASGIAHEHQQSLTGVLTFSSLLKDELKDYSLYRGSGK
jgi:C4-dicarboxylate-specific signal transduction histidine kinase